MPRSYMLMGLMKPEMNVHYKCIIPIMPYERTQNGDQRIHYDAGESIDTATGEAAPAELSSQRVYDIFSKIAQRYERFNAISSFGTHRLWLHRMVSMAKIGPESEVLDIAGGTGDVTFALARAKRPKRILCTDLVPEMLDVAKKHHADGAAGSTPVEFQVVDAQDIPFEDSSFDAVTMAYGLRNMPKRQQALDEMFRVLRPGGQLVCLDFSTPKNPVWRGLYHVYLAHLIPFWGKVITGDGEGFVYLARSIKAFPDQAGVARLMETAGFESVEWRDCTGGIACIHRAEKPRLNAQDRRAHQ